MATYEYICLGCEQPFEQRRSMTSSVDTVLACPACGSDRVRRRFSVFAAGSAGTTVSPATGFGGTAPSGGGGCCGGGGCACGH